MKKYKITIPAFSETINAENEEEALDIFMFDYDNAHREAEFNQPIVKIIQKNQRKKRNKKCSACGGIGNIDEAMGFPVDCIKCGGTGWVKED